MIEFRQVTKRYSRFVTALEGINLEFAKGEFAFVTGPSGAGKSTLLKLLYAAERPTSGDVLVEGRSVSRLHPGSVPYLRRNMGIVFQDFKLLPRRTIRENVSLALEVCGVKPKEARRRVMETIERVGLEGMEDRRPTELSGGEQQRAAIARAIVGKPSIILADEPTGNLDESMSHDIFELLSSICRLEGATILVATHDMAEVALWPFRQVRLWESRIEADRPALWQPWEHYPAGSDAALHHGGGPLLGDLDYNETGELAYEDDDSEFILSDYSIPTTDEVAEDPDETEDDESPDTDSPAAEEDEPEAEQEAEQSEPQDEDEDESDEARPHLKAIPGGRSDEEEAS